VAGVAATNPRSARQAKERSSMGGPRIVLDWHSRGKPPPPVDP
jgi:hypothetical protein